jgi:sugar phosphate isomerase/epimerase
LPNGLKVNVDLKKMIRLLKKEGYQGYVVLEYEEEDPNKNVPEYIKLLRELINES